LTIKALPLGNVSKLDNDEAVAKAFREALICFQKTEGLWIAKGKNYTSLLEILASSAGNSS
jgi:hypothetical protein